MKYSATLCGGLLATAVLLSFPHASSALPAAPSALLPAAHSSDLIIVRGGGGRGGGGAAHARGGGGAAHAQMGGGGGGAAHARTGGGNVNRNANVNRNVNRNVNVNRHVGGGGGVVRPWVRGPYFGTIVGGVALGALIAATAVPGAPADGLCVLVLGGPVADSRLLGLLPISGEAGGRASAAICAPRTGGIHGISSPRHG